MTNANSIASPDLRHMAEELYISLPPVHNARKVHRGGEPPDVVIAARRSVFRDTVSETSLLVSLIMDEGFILKKELNSIMLCYQAYV